MKLFLRDLARVVSLTENALFLIGKSLQRRALRNGVLVAMAYGSTLLGVKLGGENLSPEQVATLLVASFASYPVGAFLTLLSGFLSQGHISIAHAARLDLMGQYKQTRLTAHLRLIWQRVFRHESRLDSDRDERRGERESLSEHRARLDRALDALPAELVTDWHIDQPEQRAHVIHRILTSFPRSHMLETTGDAFVVTASYALTHPLPQREQELSCGFDIAVLEKWYRKGLFTSEDSLLRDFASDSDIRRVADRVGHRWLNLARRFLDPEHSPTLWYTWTLRKLAISLGKALSEANRPFHKAGRPPFFDAQDFLWPGTAIEDQIADRVGPDLARTLTAELLNRRCKLIRNVFASDSAGVRRMVYRMFLRDLRATLQLRLAFDLEYASATLAQTPDADLCELRELLGHTPIATDKLPDSKQLAADATAALARIESALGHTVIEPEARRALGLAWHSNWRGMQKLMHRSRDLPALAALAEDAIAHRLRFSRELVRLRLYHSLTLIQVALYIDIIEQLSGRPGLSTE